MTVVLLSISGDRERLREAVARRFGDREVHFMPWEDCAVRPLTSLIKDLLRLRCEAFGIGCSKLHPKGKASFLKGLTFLPRCQERFLVDEHGQFLRCRLLESLVTDLPSLVAKLSASLFLIIVSYGLLLPTKALLIFRSKTLQHVRNQDRILKNG